jgi:hemerythrin-like domain-containing protein
LMHDVVSYLREVPDSSHHPREDVAFACLLRHLPELRLQVNRLLQEHRVIAVAGDELLSRLDEVTGGAVIERATLEAAAATYLAYYRHHLAREDADILPRAGRMLTAQDWAQVAQAVPREPDPLFGPSLHERYRDLHKLLNPSADAGPG